MINNIKMTMKIHTTKIGFLYIHLLFFPEIHRHVEFFAFIILLPGVVLHCLTLVVFMVPYNMGDKVATGKGEKGVVCVLGAERNEGLMRVCVHKCEYNYVMEVHCLTLVVFKLT